MSCGNCGHPVRRRADRERRRINPAVPGGTRLLYVGAGPKVFAGSASGLTYYVSEQLRIFAAHPRDVEELLGHRDVVAAP